MSRWPSVSAKELRKVLSKRGWVLKRQKGSHQVLSHPDYPDFVFAFHEHQEIGPKMVARIAKQIGLLPSDFR